MFFTNLIGYVVDMLKTLFHFIEIAIKNWQYTLSIVIFVVLLVITIRILYCVLSRLIFIVKVKKANIKVMFNRNPLASLFSKKARLDITVTNNNEVYSVYFFPGLSKRKKNIYINSFSEFYVSNPTAQVAMGRWSGGFNKFIINTDDGALAKKKHTIEIKEPTDNNILVFNPNPLEVFILKDNKYEIMGSGDTFENIKLFYATDFIKYLNR